MNMLLLSNVVLTGVAVAAAMIESGRDRVISPATVSARRAPVRRERCAVETLR